MIGFLAVLVGTALLVAVYIVARVHDDRAAEKFARLMRERDKIGTRR